MSVESTESSSCSINFYALIACVHAHNCCTGEYNLGPRLWLGEASQTPWCDKVVGVWWKLGIHSGTDLRWETPRRCKGHCYLGHLHFQKVVSVYSSNTSTYFLSRFYAEKSLNGCTKMVGHHSSSLTSGKTSLIRFQKWRGESSWVLTTEGMRNVLEPLNCLQYRGTLLAWRQ